MEIVNNEEFVISNGRKGDGEGYMNIYGGKSDSVIDYASMDLMKK